MRSVPTTDALFLDFDGVLCDSLEECFRSSWLAGSGIPVGTVPPPEPPFDAAYRTRFDAARPFVRSGEDYLVVHEWAAQGKVPVTQADFDASLSSHGPEAMAEKKKRLYETRDRLLEFHRARWLSWNPLYGGIAEALQSQADNPGVWILSTKKAEFIAEILAYHGVSWPLERTVYTGPLKKLDLISDLVPGRSSILIDDQIDHLDFGHRSCRCFLALWGYVTPGATARAPGSLTLPQALDLISSFPGARRPAG